MGVTVGGLFDLSGTVALVTGAGQGNGEAIALRLARAGADVAVNDVREESAANVADAIRSIGRRSMAVLADISSVREIDEALRRTVSELGRLDVLVNNAG